MTETDPHPMPPPEPPVETAEQPPAEAGSVWVEDHAPPADEAAREALETVRSISRLEEAN